MKKSIFIILISMIILAGCKTQKQATVSENDDVYAPKGGKTSIAPSGTMVIQDLSAPAAIQADSGGGTLPGSSTLEGDYNDYSARIQRFNHPDKSKGYFDESYTGTTNYDTLQGSPDVNVYVGTGCDYGWDPGFSFSLGFGWGYPYYGSWGYPYYGYYPYYDWWYSPWGYPYYYGNYWTGYYDGYNNGYWDGYNGYPYDPNYYSSTYYGRRNTSSSGDLTGPVVNPRTTNPPFQENMAKSERTADAAKNERSEVSSVSGTRANPSEVTGSSTPTYNRTTSENNINQVSAGRTTSTQSGSQKQRYTYTRSNSAVSATNQRTTGKGTRTETQKSSPRYTRPVVQSGNSRATTTQSYASPSYRQPKSSQEYINPHPQSGRTLSTTQDKSSPRSASIQNQNQRQSGSSSGTSHYSSPSQSRSYSRPSRTPSSSGSNAIRSRSSNQNSSEPSRSSSSSYSNPSRSSSPSYSSPSRSSSPSYSSPSRSGGNSGGSSGGNSGGGGRRR